MLIVSTGAPNISAPGIPAGVMTCVTVTAPNPAPVSIPDRVRVCSATPAAVGCGLTTGSGNDRPNLAMRLPQIRGVSHRHIQLVAIDCAGYMPASTSMPSGDSQDCNGHRCQSGQVSNPPGVDPRHHLGTVRTLGNR